MGIEEEKNAKIKIEQCFRSKLLEPICSEKPKAKPFTDEIEML